MLVWAMVYGYKSYRQTICHCYINILLVTQFVFKLLAYRTYTGRLKVLGCGRGQKNEGLYE